MIGSVLYLTFLFSVLSCSLLLFSVLWRFLFLCFVLSVVVVAAVVSPACVVLRICCALYFVLSLETYELGSHFIAHS